mmetsp:Transcript_63529/g.141704  ORF Transcript_63529/g.141704 Transcript_63529/m.141704 type:complete len:251 (+) Transcript_63529:770-1522(+)
MRFVYLSAGGRPPSDGQRASNARRWSCGATGVGFHARRAVHVCAFLASFLVDVAPCVQVGPHAFVVAREHVDEVVRVDEKDVALAVLRLVETQKMVVEGGGATGLAALLPGGPLDREDMKGKNVVVPLCGGNIDITVLGRVIERGLAADSRLLSLTIPVSDRPGGIAELTTHLSQAGASVKDIFHERAWLQSSVDQVIIKAVLETLGPEHNREILLQLEAAYPEAEIQVQPDHWCRIPGQIDGPSKHFHL